MNECAHSVPFCLKTGWRVVLATEQGKSDVQCTCLQHHLKVNMFKTPEMCLYLDSEV